MGAQQRMKVANEKAKKALELRGNVPKSTVNKNKNTGLFFLDGISNFYLFLF